MVLTRIEPMSLAKVSAVIYGVMMLLFALPYGCILSAVGDQFGGSGLGAGLGLGLIISMPIAGAIGGFIGGLITAFIYNLVAGWVGGVEIEVDGMDGGDIL